MMKNSTKFLVLSIIWLAATVNFSFAGSGKPVPVHPLKKAVMSNGWYTATVHNLNSTTYTDEAYQLQVRIEDGAVTAINFGNGSLVHAGVNSEGYAFTGGALQAGQPAAGNTKITASTTIVLKDNLGSGEFLITL